MNQVYSCPLHEHPLEKVNPLTAYPAYGGHWKCDNCSKEHNANSLPFHCRICSFDLCSSCLQGNISLAHRHPLFLVDTSRLYNTDWRCDVCRESSNSLRETFTYHCAVCNFDICRSCFQPKQHPIHRHELKVTDTSLIYAQTGGNWFCDVCTRSSRNSERFSHHCSECEFDVCQDCFRPQQSPLHVHALLKADSHHIYATFNGGWRCDHCGSVHNNPTDNHPWHCETCSYDLCDDCMGTQIEAPDVTGPSPGQYGGNWPPDWLAPSTVSVAPARQPVENPWVLRRRLSPPSSPPDGCPVPVSGPVFTTERGNAVTNPEEMYTDDNSKCIICMENPKNATLIHGDTGHCCCCWLCAQVLKQRRDPCPICRAPIDHVIRQYNA